MFSKRNVICLNAIQCFNISILKKFLKFTFQLNQVETFKGDNAPLHLHATADDLIAYFANFRLVVWVCSIDHKLLFPIQMVWLKRDKNLYSTKTLAFKAQTFTFAAFCDVKRFTLWRRKMYFYCKQWPIEMYMELQLRHCSECISWFGSIPRYSFNAHRTVMQSYYCAFACACL